MVFSKVYLIGNGRVADECLKIINQRNIPVEYIELDEEKFSFTKKLCDRLGIKFSHYSKNDIEDLLSNIQKKVLIISAHNSYLFPAKVCDNKNLTIINLHIAYLPEYRGMNPSTWAIYNQSEYAGVTWHLIDSKIDNGAIIVQRKIPIDCDDTAIKLMLRCFKEGINLFEENFDAFINQSLSTFVPNKSNTRVYYKNELPNDGYLNEKWGFEKTYAFLRSMDYSGTNLMRLPRIILEGKTYEILKYKKIIVGDLKSNRIDKWDNNIIELCWGGYSLICDLRLL